MAKLSRYWGQMEAKLYLALACVVVFNINFRNLTGRDRVWICRLRHVQPICGRGSRVAARRIEA